MLESQLQRCTAENRRARCDLGQAFSVPETRNGGAGRHPEYITDRQLLALRLVAESIASRGVPPTLREIGSTMRIRSTNGVCDHLMALERKGFITRERIFSRAIVITDKGRTLLEVRGGR